MLPTTMTSPSRSGAFPADATSSSDGVYEDVFVAHHRSIFRLAVVLSGDRHLAEEITAEVFAKVLPRWRQGTVRDPLLYLRRAVVNDVRSRSRPRANERRAIERIGQQLRAEPTPEAPVVSEPIASALRQLPVRQRAVIVLRFHDDLGEAEVARILRLPVGTVKTHTRRGLAALRSLLGEAT